MRLLSPVLRLGITALLALAAALAAILLATSQPWLGVTLAPSETGVVLSAVSPRSPAAGAKLGDLVAVIPQTGPVMRLQATDVTPEPDVIETYAQVNAFLARQDALANAVASGPVTLETAWGGESARTLVAAAPSRPIGDLPAVFWVQIVSGVLAFLIGAWVWSLKPSDWAARFFALTGVSMLAFTHAAAVYSTRELALPATLFRALSGLNLIGAVSFGGAMIALFLTYPKPIVRLRNLLLIPAIIVPWVALALLQIFPGPPTGGHLPVMIEMIGILVCIGLQAWATRRDPSARAALVWLGLSVALGAGAFVFLSGVPVLLDIPPVMNQGYGFAFFLLIYVGLALGLRRYRLFEMGEWAFRILFYTGAALGFLLLDAGLVYALGLTPVGSLGLSLLLVAFLYLPLRNQLWARTVGRRGLKSDALFPMVIETAFAGSQAERSERWRALLQRLFDPLEMTESVDAVAGAGVDEDGLRLRLPPTADTPALVLAYPWAGRGLFGPSHLALARQLLTLMGHAEAGRSAYERGVAGERKRIAQDLHDDVGARLLTGLQQNNLGQTRETVREAMYDIRAIVGALSGKGATLGRAIADMRYEAGRRLEAAGIDLDWPIGALDDDTTLLPYPTYKAWMSAQREAISNIIRHSKAQVATIGVRRAGDALVIDIADDGVGLQPAGRKGSGLGNMVQRLVALGGTMTNPASERGHRIEMTVPLSAAPMATTDA